MLLYYYTTVGLTYQKIGYYWLEGKTLSVQGECCDNLRCLETAGARACGQHTCVDQSACQFSLQWRFCQSASGPNLSPTCTTEFSIHYGRDKYGLSSRLLFVITIPGSESFTFPANLFAWRERQGRFAGGDLVTESETGWTLTRGWDWGWCHFYTVRRIRIKLWNFNSYSYYTTCV